MVRMHSNSKAGQEGGLLAPFYGRAHGAAIPMALRLALRHFGSQVVARRQSVGGRPRALCHRWCMVGLRWHEAIQRCSGERLSSEVPSVMSPTEEKLHAVLDTLN